MRCLLCSDEMLSRGFKDQIYLTFQQVGPDVQVGLFSATLDKETIDITDRFMTNPIRILVRKEEVRSRVACCVVLS